MAVYQGLIDELVPVSGVTLQMKRLRDLGFQYRYYPFPNYEHYTHPVVDEWTEGRATSTAIGAIPTRRTSRMCATCPSSRRWRRARRASSRSPGISFDFDRAYWMSKLTPVDAVAGVARFDGRSLASPSARPRFRRSAVRPRWVRRGRSR